MEGVATDQAGPARAMRGPTVRLDRVDEPLHDYRLLDGLATLSGEERQSPDEPVAEPAPEQLELGHDRVVRALRSDLSILPTRTCQRPRATKGPRISLGHWELERDNEGDAIDRHMLDQRKRELDFPA